MLLRRWPRWNRAHLRCFVRDRSSPADQNLDPLEKLKFWNLTNDLRNAIKHQHNETAVGLLPSLKEHQLITPMHCTEFLQSCSEVGNAKFAKDLLKFMDDHGVETTERSYSHFLGALSRSGNLQEAWQTLESLAKREDVHVDTLMINSVLNGCCLSSKDGSYYAHKCLDMISALGLEKDHGTYVELIKLAGKGEDLEAIKQLWEELKGNFPLVLNSYRVYIIALSRAMDLNEAVSMLQEMLDLLSKTLKSSEPIPPSVIEVFNAIMNAAGKIGEYELAESLFTEMKRMELQVNIMSYNALIRAVVKGRGVDYGLKLVNSMEGIGLEPNTLTYSAIVEGYCKNFQLDKAEKLLEQMLVAKPSQRPSCYTFNFLLQACSSTNDQGRALRVFHTMKKELVAPDICTYVALFSVFGSVSLPFSGGDQESHDNLNRRLQAIETDMSTTSIRHSKESFTAMLQTLGTEGMLGALMKRLFNAEVYAREGGAGFLDAQTYTTVMYALIMNKQAEEAKEVFQRMVTNGIKPDLHAYNVMLLGCSMNKTLNYAYELVEEMQKNGISPDAVTYNTLIKVACASGEVEPALEIIQTMDRIGVEANLSTFNGIISAAAVQGRVDMIEFLISDMQDRKIAPNTSTILKVMLAYIQVKQLDNAIHAVRRLSFQMAGLEKKEGKNKLQEVMQVLLEDNDLQAEELTNHLGSSIAEPTSTEEDQALYGISLSGFLTGPEEGWNNVSEQS